MLELGALLASPI
jgi:hypothetical protein